VTQLNAERVIQAA